MNVKYRESITRINDKKIEMKSKNILKFIFKNYIIRISYSIQKNKIIHLQTE